MEFDIILHSRQLTLFSMICRLRQDPLHAHAQFILTRSQRLGKSWFNQIIDICDKYSLPHPLHLLQNPPTKRNFKLMVKIKVHQYWENLLRSETLHLSSLQFFRTSRLSLNQPSILWLLSGSNSYEVAKSLVVAKMTSGRYRSDYLSRYWTPSNRQGFCLAETCRGVYGDLVHMLVTCPSLATTRERMKCFLRERSLSCPPLHQIIADILVSSPEVQAMFLLDPCEIPAISAHCCETGLKSLLHVYYLTRTFVYYMHRAKMIALGRWPGDPNRKPIKTNPKLKPGATKIIRTLNNSNFYDNYSNSVILGNVPASTQYAVTEPTPVVLPQYQHNDMDMAGAAVCSSRPSYNQNHDHGVLCCAVATAGHMREEDSRNHVPTKCLCSARVTTMVDDPPFRAVATFFTAT